MAVPSKVNTIEAAAALGHVNRAIYEGVTAEYIGPQKHDIWSDRLANPILNESFEIDMIDASFKRRKKVKHDEILDMCEKNGLDYNVRRERDRAVRLIHDEDKEQFLKKHQLLDEDELSGQGNIKDLESGTSLYCNNGHNAN